MCCYKRVSVVGTKGVVLTVYPAAYSTAVLVQCVELISQYLPRWGQAEPLLHCVASQHERCLSNARHMQVPSLSRGLEADERPLQPDTDSFPRSTAALRCAYALSWQQSCLESDRRCSVAGYVSANPTRS